MSEPKKDDEVVLQYDTSFRDFEKASRIYHVKAGTIGRVKKLMPMDGNVAAGAFVVKFHRVPITVWCSLDEIRPLNTLDRIARGLRRG